ncbi:pirin family protein [Nocardia sp. 2YAB30]|uniref:pirin family protein n=1 Tax=Nocardia sp. 2YAB30 TaxID=3233022 RepID=UPI003F983E59
MFATSAPKALKLGPLHHMNRLILDAGHWADYDPFLFVTEDVFAKGNFHFHPHCGLETITVVVEGQMLVRDTHGAEWLFDHADAQVTTAASGVVHDEQPPDDARSLHSLQLWINLPQNEKQRRPRYQNLRAADLPTVEKDGFFARVYSGEFAGATAPTLHLVPVILAELRLDQGAQTVLDLPADYNAFLYVLEGNCSLGADETPINGGEIVHLPPHSRSRDGELLRANTAARAYLWAGVPIGEPSPHPDYNGNAAQKALAYADYLEPTGANEDIVESQEARFAKGSPTPEVIG